MFLFREVNLLWKKKIKRKKLKSLKLKKQMQIIKMVLKKYRIVQKNIKLKFILNLHYKIFNKFNKKHKNK